MTDGEASDGDITGDRWILDFSFHSLHLILLDLLFDFRPLSSHSPCCTLFALCELLNFHNLSLVFPSL
jgi:hypothetical protein